jgi:O-acetylserine/cysteine efflux transporter
LDSGGNRDRNAKIILLVITVIWGLNTPVMKIGLMDLSPMVYNAYRVVIAAILSLAILLITKSYKPMPMEDFKKIVTIGIVGYFINQLFFIFGLSQTTAGNSSLVLATLPVEVALINRIFRIEAISRRMMAGIITGLLGVVLIVLGSNKELSLFGPHLIGALVLLLAQFCYAYYTVFIKELNDRYSIYQIFTYVMVINAVLFSIIALPELKSTEWNLISEAAVYSILFSAIFALVMGNMMWIWVVGTLGSTKASLSQYFCPVVSIAFAWVYLDETFGALQFIGAVVILLGLYLTLNQSPANATGISGEMSMERERPS